MSGSAGAVPGVDVLRRGREREGGGRFGAGQQPAEGDGQGEDAAEAVRNEHRRLLSGRVKMGTGDRGAVVPGDAPAARAVPPASLPARPRT